jgi:hypothetical protein
MATLRITLAELQHKERQLDTLIQQFRTQLRRLPRQVIYGNTSLDLSLSAMAEIEERLADSLATRRRLLAIKKTALEELEALQLIKRVDEARSKLENLKRQSQANGLVDEIATEIRALEQFIAENSKRAEWAITASYQEQHQPG